MKFSNTTNAFYSEELLNEYSTLPTDLQDVSEEDYTKFLNGELGYSVEMDSDGSLIERVVKEVTTQEQISATSKQNRDSAVNANLLFNKVYFQVTNDCADIKSALQEAELLKLEDEYSQLWRLADNTWRQTTIAEAKQIVTLFIGRKQKVWAAFSEWDSGDKTSVFVYTEAEE